MSVVFLVGNYTGGPWSRWRVREDRPMGALNRRRAGAARRTGWRGERNIRPEIACLFIQWLRFLTSLLARLYLIKLTPPGSGLGNFSSGGVRVYYAWARAAARQRLAWRWRRAELEGETEPCGGRERSSGYTEAGWNEHCELKVEEIRCSGEPFSADKILINLLDELIPEQRAVIRLHTTPSVLLA